MALSPAEQQVAARAATRKQLFVFLRESRGELFDDAFQDELLAMYRQTGAGKPPVPPALWAMATVLQAYTGVGDQEAVELTADSQRWQLVLGCLGAEEPTFSQGALFDRLNLDSRRLRMARPAGERGLHCTGSEPP